MPVLETIRAWKDEEYGDTLTAEQRAQVPEHPAGTIEFQGSDRVRLGMGTFTGGGCCSAQTKRGANC